MLLSINPLLKKILFLERGKILRHHKKLLFWLLELS